jgi:hypothetical protein
MFLEQGVPGLPITYRRRRGLQSRQQAGKRPTIVDYFSDRPADRFAGHRGGLGLGSAAWEARCPLLANAPNRLYRPAYWGCLGRYLAGRPAFDFGFAP